MPIDVAEEATLAESKGSAGLEKYTLYPSNGPTGAVHVKFIWLVKPTWEPASEEGGAGGNWL